jgi:chain length determinant protein EpsF
MTFRQNLLVLRARYKIALAVAAAVVTIAMGVGLIMPKTYSATAAMLVDVKAADPLGGAALAAALPPPVLQSYLATQIQIVMSERNAMRVIKGLKLDEDPENKKRWMSETEGLGSYDVWLAEAIRKQLEVKPSRDSHVVYVTYTGRTSKEAADIANAFTEAAVRTDLELKVRPARESVEFLDERTKVLRRQLEQAQERLSQYQRKQGITATDDRLDIENARLSELSTQLTLIQSLAFESGSRQAEVQRGADALPEVLANPLIQSLKGELAKQEAKLRELGVQLGPNHPQYERAASEVAELRARVASESAAVARSLGTSNRVNRSREAEVRAAMEAQKQKVLTLKRQRDEASILVREVENAQKAYDAVTQRRSQTTLESQANLSNLSILAPATEPTRHTNPKLRLILVLSILAGGLLGVVSAFALESVDRRVRDVEDLSEVGQFPLLAVLQGNPADDKSASSGPMPLLPGPSISR